MNTPCLGGFCFGALGMEIGVEEQFGAADTQALGTEMQDDQEKEQCGHEESAGSVVALERLGQQLAGELGRRHRFLPPVSEEQTVLPQQGVAGKESFII